MLATLAGVGIDHVHLDLGDADIFRTLCNQIGLTRPDQESLFALLQCKAQADVGAFASAQGLSLRDTEVLSELCMLHGDSSVLERARQLLAPYGDDMLDTIARLGHVGHALTDVQGCTVHFDLAELRGYQYHNGVVFAAYVSDVGVEIARGGRYDGIGDAFGRSRPATGYSTDLKNLMRIVGSADNTIPSAVLAPAVTDPELHRMVAALRAQGEIVITDLGHQSSTTCDRELVQHNGKWLLENR